MTNTHITRALSALAIVGTLSSAAWLGTAIAHAEPVETINLSDVQDINSLPICTMEDCSDQVGQVGMWMDSDTGNWYLERGESTWLIMDDTAR